MTTLQIFGILFGIISFLVIGGMAAMSRPQRAESENYSDEYTSKFGKWLMSPPKWTVENVDVR